MDRSCTLVSTAGVPDDVYQLARSQFSEKELVDLIMAIIAINGWNRLAVSFSDRGPHISAAVSHSGSGARIEAPEDGHVREQRQ